MKLEVSISQMLASGKSPEDVVKEILARDGGREYSENQIRLAVADHLKKQPEASIRIPGWQKYKN